MSDEALGMDLEPIRPFLEPRHVALAREIADFAVDRIAPLPRPSGDEEAREQAREIVRRLGGAGVTGWVVPASLGGESSAPDLRACCLVREIVAAVSPLADAVFALQCLGSVPLALAGTGEQSSTWLTGVLTGEAMAAFAMTEEEAGSDVAAIATRARAEGDGWVLDGAKTLISNAGIADFYLTFASTDPEAGHRGISAFLVPADAPGLRFVGPQVLSAPHPLGEIAFDGCRLPADALVGEKGGGLRLGLATLDRLRPTVAAAACGMARRALDEAVAHARSRRQFGKTLAEHQLVQSSIAAMAIDLEAARLLTYRAALAVDEGSKGTTRASAIAKAHATEAAQRIVDRAVQILGGRGALAESTVDHLYRSVRALRIYEGTTEIQHLIIARDLLRP